MVSKNFDINYVGWDKHFQGRGSAFTTFFNAGENVRSLLSALSYPLMRKGT
jgi:hypothetical protein